MSKSLFIAIIGLFLAYLGINMILAGIGITFILAWVNLFGISTTTGSLSFLTGLSIAGAIVGIIITYFGSKLYFQNETEVGKLLFGILGLLITLSGVSIALGSGGTAVFIGLIVISIGLSFLGYAFKIRPLEPLTKIVNSYKKLIGVRS